MNNQIICYDVEIVPDGVELNRIVELAEETNYLIYDSFHARQNGNSKPYPYMLNPNKKPTKILVDISTLEGQEIYKEIIERNNESTNQL